MEATKVQLRANRASVANYGYHCSMFIDGYKQGCQDDEREQKDSLTKKWMMRYNHSAQILSEEPAACSVITFFNPT